MGPARQASVPKNAIPASRAWDRGFLQGLNMGRKYMSCQTSNVSFFISILVHRNEIFKCDTVEYDQPCSLRNTNKKPCASYNPTKANHLPSEISSASST